MRFIDDPLQALIKERAGHLGRFLTEGGRRLGVAEAEQRLTEQLVRFGHPWFFERIHLDRFAREAARVAGRP